jgi:16S rRNA (guanine966-N2)-methyltransferase
MRIIAGSAKGHSLKVPREVSRPTTDRVRESVFGILTAVIPNARVLDLYAGSGALGIEALSRGGASCTFVEQNRGACRVIAENLNKTGSKEGRVIQRDVGAFLNSEKTSYDLIFADPPYADGLRDPARDLIAIQGWERWLLRLFGC